MEINENEVAWMPEDRPNYLVIHSKNQPMPLDREMFLILQAKLLARLVKEAGPGEIKDANRRLEDGLELEFKMHLPSGMLKNPKTPSALMFNPAIMETPLQEWKSEIREALASPMATQEEIQEELESLSLEGYLSRIVY